MNTTIIFQRLQGVEDEINKLNNILFALKTTDIQRYGANYEELSTDAALRAEPDCLPAPEPGLYHRLYRKIHLHEAGGKCTGHPYLTGR